MKTNEDGLRGVFRAVVRVSDLCRMRRAVCGVLIALSLAARLAVLACVHVVWLCGGLACRVGCAVERAARAVVVALYGAARFLAECAAAAERAHGGRGCVFSQGGEPCGCGGACDLCGLRWTCSCRAFRGGGLMVVALACALGLSSCSAAGGCAGADGAVRVLPLSAGAARDVVKLCGARGGGL